MAESVALLFVLFFSPLTWQLFIQSVWKTKGCIESQISNFQSGTQRSVVHNQISGLGRRDGHELTVWIAQSSEVPIGVRRRINESLLGGKKRSGNLFCFFVNLYCWISVTCSTKKSHRRRWTNWDSDVPELCSFDISTTIHRILQGEKIKTNLQRVWVQILIYLYFYIALSL